MVIGRLSFIEDSKLVSVHIVFKLSKDTCIAQTAEKEREREKKVGIFPSIANMCRVFSRVPEESFGLV